MHWELFKADYLAASTESVDFTWLESYITHTESSAGLR